jgi:serine/threonine protein kinase
MPKAQDDDLVMSLVELALSQPPDAREAYVRTACAGDPELFTEVWEYVRWDLQMQDFLLEPLYAALPEHHFEPGELLADRFRIIREVAQGGMGIVYEAEDERLGRRIALKCAKSGFHKRLPPEVRHASEISHPNVCKIFEIHTASTTSGEIDFLTMEFLDGETLAARLARGPLPEAERLATGRQICSGLAEAHRHHVVHGDLKSNNVILTRDADGSLRTVVTDFGLARKPHGPAGPNTASWASSAAGSSQAGGTPDYMAPELWKGEKPTTASDVYALGVILRELTSGRPRHGWDSILEKCLDPDPAKRFRDAGEVAVALEPSRALRWWLAAAAAVLLAAISGLVTFQRATAPKQTVRLALLPFQSIPDQSSPDTADVAAELSRNTAAQLARLKGNSQIKLVFVPQRDVARKSATHAIRGTLEKKNDNELLHVYLTDTRTGVDTKDWTFEYAPAQLRYAPVAIAGIVTSALHLPPIEAKLTVSAAARQDYLTGLSYVQDNVRPDDAVQFLERAVAADPDSPLTFTALAEAQFFKYLLTRDEVWKAKAQESVRQAELRNPDVAEVHAIAGLLEANSSLYELAKSDYERTIELQPVNGDAYRRLSAIYYRDAQADEALAAIKKAIEVQPDEFRNYQQLGTLYIRQGNYQAALPEFQRMVGLAPSVPEAHFALGAALEYLGRFPEAEAEIRTSVGLQDSSNAELELGTILLDERRNREAIACFRSALDLGPKTGELWLNLGRAFSLQHRAGDARSAFQKGLAASETVLARDPKEGSERARLGYMAARLGDAQRAETEAAQALQVSRDDTDTCVWAVLTYEVLGRRDQSLELLTRAPTILSQLNRYIELADLEHDPRLQELSGKNRVH